MGGRIWVESDLGQGACVQVRLALTTAGPAPVPIGAAARARAAQVLLVDDNLLGQKVTGATLAKLGLGVRAATDGQQALDIFAAGGIDLVLMDIQMPVMDGFEATRRLRALEAERAWPRTPVLALTANTMAADRDACLAAGMDDFIPRPVSKAGLKEALGRWVEI
jgi:CheY-like chemotaxis protein